MARGQRAGCSHQSRDGRRSQDPIFLAIHNSPNTRRFLKHVLAATDVSIRIVPPMPASDMPSLPALNKCWAGKKGCPCTRQRTLVQQPLTRKFSTHRRTCPGGRTMAVHQILYEGKHVATFLTDPVVEGCVNLDACLGLLEDWALKIPSEPSLRRLSIGDGDARIAKACRYIKEHFTEPLESRQVAGLVGMTPHYFCRLFHKVTGQKFKQYLAWHRVEYAKHLLVTTTDSIATVSENAGFPSVGQFNKTFKQLAKMPPSRWRERK